MDDGALGEWIEALPDWERDGPTDKPADARPFSPVPTRQCLDDLGVLPLSCQVLHVVGSNGKGTASSVAASLLQAHGLRVGLYQSPHLRARCERISIDGVAIDTSTYLGLMARLKDLCPKGLSRFEIETAAACLHFAGAGVDVAVLEAGLGGITDATHAVPADVVALTSVELEHTAVLGHSLASIARQKAGVLAERGHLVSGHLAAEAEAVVSQLVTTRAASWWRADLSGWGRRICRRDGTLIQVDKIQDATCDTVGKTPDGDVFLPLRGTHLVDMAMVGILGARAILEKMGLAWSDQASEALGRLVLPGRLQLVSEVPPVLLDVAHTPLAMAAAIRACCEHMEGAPGALLLAINRDKPFVPLMQSLADAFLPEPAVPIPLILTTNPGPRGAAADTLAHVLATAPALERARHCFEVDVFASVPLAWQRLVQRLEAADGRCGLAMGSFRLVAMLLELLAESQYGRS